MSAVALRFARAGGSSAGFAKRLEAPRRVTGPCCFCHRPASTCWILPCLELDCALRSEDNALMTKWAHTAGIGLSYRNKVIVPPPSEDGVCS